MTSYSLRVACVALLTAGVVSAQPPAAAPAQPAGADATHTFRAKQILGKKILLKNNAAMGTVEDIVFDDAGNLEYLIVSNDANKLVTVPWDAARWDADHKTATVNVTPEVYKTIPTYTPTTYPAFYTPAYRTQVYKYYNLTPRQLRRIDRIERRNP
jgi:sporulation protein YlmC with PRC-barrel domain